MDSVCVRYMWDDENVNWLIRNEKEMRIEGKMNNEMRMKLHCSLGQVCLPHLVAVETMLVVECVAMFVCIFCMVGFAPAFALRTVRHWRLSGQRTE